MVVVLVIVVSITVVVVVVVVIVAVVVVVVSSSSSLLSSSSSSSSTLSSNLYVQLLPMRQTIFHPVSLTQTPICTNHCDRHWKRFLVFTMSATACHKKPLNGTDPPSGVSVTRCTASLRRSISSSAQLPLFISDEQQYQSFRSARN